MYQGLSWLFPHLGKPKYIGDIEVHSSMVLAGLLDWLLYDCLNPITLPK